MAMPCRSWKQPIILIKAQLAKKDRKAAIPRYYQLSAKQGLTKLK